MGTLFAWYTVVSNVSFSKDMVSKADPSHSQPAWQSIHWSLSSDTRSHNYSLRMTSLKNQLTLMIQMVHLEGDDPISIDEEATKANVRGDACKREWQEVLFLFLLHPNIFNNTL